MSKPSIESERAEWLDSIITELKKELGRFPSIQEFQDALDGDWRTGEE